MPVKLSQTVRPAESHWVALQDGFGQLGDKICKFVDVIGSETAYVSNLKRKIGPAIAIKIGGVPNHVTQDDKLVNPLLTLGKLMPGSQEIGGKMLCSFTLLGGLIVLDNLPGNLGGVLSIVKVAVIAFTKIAIVENKRITLPDGMSLDAFKVTGQTLDMFGGGLDLILGIVNLGSNPRGNPGCKLGDKLPGNFTNFRIVVHASKDMSAH